MLSQSVSKRTFIAPWLIALGVISLALLLLTIGARSPFTQANLGSGFDAGYTRTGQSIVGSLDSYAGEGGMRMALASDPVVRGGQLFVGEGCASCHGIAGRAGVVGPPIVGVGVDKLRDTVRKGPGGMLTFAPDVLTEDDLVAIAAYLKSTGK